MAFSDNRPFHSFVKLLTWTSQEKFVNTTGKCVPMTKLDGHIYRSSETFKINIYMFCNKMRAKYASTCKTTGNPDVLRVTTGISKPITHLGTALPVTSAVL